MSATTMSRTAAPARGNGVLELARFTADPLRYLDRIRDDDRDIVPYRHGGRSHHLVKRPEYIETALASPVWAAPENELRDSMLRDPMMPGIAVARAHRRADSWVEGQSFELFGELRSLVWGIDWEALTGEDLDEQSDLLPRGIRARAARRRLDRAIDGLIAERRGRPRGDLLSRLIDSQADDEVVRTTLKQALGTDELHGTLTWALQLLAAHPEIEHRWHLELDDVLGSREAVYDDVRSLGYTTRIVNETLRLFPPTWAFVRTLTEDLRLGDTVIPTGDAVVLSPWITQRDGRVWRDPLRFDPDRWADAAEQPPGQAFFPFAAHRPAKKEAVLVLVTLGQRWMLRPSRRGEPRPFASGTIAPRSGLRMTPVARAT
jgi:cytochrome P450